MNERSYFSLAVRIVGVVLCVYALDWLSRFGFGKTGYLELKETTITYYFLLGLGSLMIGAYLLRGAPHFVRYAYPYDDDEDYEEPPPVEEYEDQLTSKPVPGDITKGEKTDIPKLNDTIHE
jgi:hypothetical protein